MARSAGCSRKSRAVALTSSAGGSNVCLYLPLSLLPTPPLSTHPEPPNQAPHRSSPLSPPYPSVFTLQMFSPPPERPSSLVRWPSARSSVQRSHPLTPNPRTNAHPRRSPGVHLIYAQPPRPHHARTRCYLRCVRHVHYCDHRPHLPCRRALGARRKPMNPHHIYFGPCSQPSPTPYSHTRRAPAIPNTPKYTTHNP